MGEHAGTAFGQSIDKYIGFRPRPPRVTFEIIAKAVGHPRARAVDLGAGTGHGTEPLLALFDKVTAVEIDPVMAAELEGLGENLEVQRVELLDVDFFLMDNVEGIAHSSAAQEKLYHIYNQITEKGGKLAFTASLPPDKNSAMESYLTSRFQWGMVAEIKPIDDATTSKIIVKLAKDINLTMPEPIIHFLLSRIPRDFISIQNAVTTINQESYIKKKKVTLPLVKTALDLP